MQPGSRLILLFMLLALPGFFLWSLWAPKPDLSEYIQQTLKEQEAQADLSFKAVTFAEMSGATKYWELQAQSATVNKSSGLATLKKATGNFFKDNLAVLRFKSPAALWDMKRKEIMLDQPLGYDAKLEGRVAALSTQVNQSVFNLPEKYQSGAGYWFQAKNLSWKLADQKLSCAGGIVLNKGEVTGFAERLNSDVALEKVVLAGSPKLVITPRNLTPIFLEAEIIEVLSAQDTIIARGQPKIFWQDAQITTDDIKYQQGQKTILFNGHVMLTYQDIRAQSETAKYLTESGIIILSGQAQARQGGNFLSGNQVQVSLVDKKIALAGQGKILITEEKLQK